MDAELNTVHQAAGNPAYAACVAPSCPPAYATWKALLNPTEAGGNYTIKAVCDALSHLPAKRRFIMLSHAGDRSDQDIRDVTATALNFQPDFIVAAELEGYLRGRELGEIPDLIEKTISDQGAYAKQVLRASSPSQAASLILEKLEPGDLALLLVLSERDAVLAMLDK